MEAALICLIFNDDLFVFGKLVQTVHFIGTDCSREWARIFRCNKWSSDSGESNVFGCVEDHANVSVVTATIGGWDGSKHCFKSSVSWFMSSLIVGH